MTAARIAPRNAPYPPAVAAALEKIMPPGVPPLGLFRTVAVNERVFLRMMAGGLLDRGTLGLRERELVIDRVTWLCGAEYEYGVHVAFFGERAGLGEAEQRALCSAEPSAEVFSPREHALLRACDELHRTSTLSDEGFAALAEHGDAAIVEIVALVGYYHAISFMVNALAIPNEPFGVPFARAAPLRDTSR